MLVLPIGVPVVYHDGSHAEPSAETHETSIPDPNNEVHAIVVPSPDYEVLVHAAAPDLITVSPEPLGFIMPT